MKNYQLNFQRRDRIERQLLTENTWCEYCNEADLGLNKPSEYEEDGKIYIIGNCNKCGNRVISEII